MAVKNAVLKIPKGQSVEHKLQKAPYHGEKNTMEKLPLKTSTSSTGSAKKLPRLSPYGSSKAKRITPKNTTSVVRGKGRIEKKY